MYNVDIDPSDYVAIGMEENKIYEQTFICGEDKLDGINVKIATAGESLENVVLKYEIRNGQGEKVGAGEIQGNQIKNNKFNKLKIKRIEETKGKKFIIRTSVENIDSTNAVSLYQANNNLVMKYYVFRFDLETFVIGCSFCLYIFFFMKLLFKLFRE